MKTIISCWPKFNEGFFFILEKNDSVQRFIKLLADRCEKLDETFYVFMNSMNVPDGVGNNLTRQLH